MVLVSSVGFVGFARSQSTCPRTLPAPLVTFCAGDPARAAQVNGNFQQLVDWIVAKVGAVGTPGVSTTSVTSNAYTPRYAAWDTLGTGEGGAAIYNDGSDYKELMVVGNNSAGSAGGRRRVGLFDDVAVHGDLTVDRNLAVRGGLAVDGMVSGGLTVNGNVSSSNNAWDGNHYTGGTAIARASEPTGSGWARGRQAYNNIQSYMCGNGEYVCGIEFWHGYNWSWYDEATRVRCCKL
jgi:hypothetical protein